MEYFLDPIESFLLPTDGELKRIADEIDKRTEGMFGLRLEDYFIVHQ